MKIRYPADQVHNPLVILRKAGYQPFTDPHSHEESFILRLTNGFYPRFHLYMEHAGNKLVFSLHLDQKKPSYEGTHAHGGEYEGATVEKEMKRIAGWVGHETGLPTMPEPTGADRATTISSESKSAQPKQKKQEKQDMFRGIFG